jgi:hypothetical protein
MPSTNKEITVELLLEIKTLLAVCCEYNENERAISFLEILRGRNWNDSLLDESPIDQEIAETLYGICMLYGEMCSFVVKNQDELNTRNLGKPGEPLYRVLNPHPEKYSVPRDWGYWKGKRFFDIFKKNENGELVFTEFKAMIQTYDVVTHSHNLMVDALLALQEGLSAK